MMDKVSLAQSLGLEYCEYEANYREFDFHGEKIKVFEWQAETSSEAWELASERVLEALVTSIKQNLKG
jgi:hypothetical protein